MTHSNHMLSTIVVAGVILSQFGCATSVDIAAATEEAAARQSPLVGQKAPGFTLRNHADRLVGLEQWRGHWIVLYFYPEDDTAGCKCQATELSRLMGDFENLNAVVVGISPDTTKRHRLFRQKYQIKITLLSDPDGTVAKMYGAWNQMGRKDDRIGRFIRSTALIDQKGLIAYHWPEVIPEGHAKRVRHKLQGFCAGR